MEKYLKRRNITWGKSLFVQGVLIQLHYGHLDIIQRAADVFGEVYVVVLNNS